MLYHCLFLVGSLDMLYEAHACPGKQTIYRTDHLLSYYFVVFLNMYTKSITRPFDCSTQMAWVGNSLNVCFNMASHVTLGLYDFLTDSAFPFVFTIIISNSFHHGVYLTFKIFHVSIYNNFCSICCYKLIPYFLSLKNGIPFKWM